MLWAAPAVGALAALGLPSSSAALPCELVWRLVCYCTLPLAAEKLDVCLQVGSILVTGLGAAALMKGPFPRATFFIAGVAVYMGTIVLEAVSMSLCSKVRPCGWTSPCTSHLTFTDMFVVHAPPAAITLLS